MCGLVGRLDPSATDLRAWVEAATDRLAHRGPDDRGTHVEEEAGLALGHRRLSILDLSSLGHQPMVSDSGRYVLAFNGEIYDHLDLRADLEAGGHRFRGTSDTEELLAAVDRWGLPAVLRRVDGMFAIALWDRRDRRLALARDRMGEKPLFVRTDRRGVRFGSELKALWGPGEPRPDVDRDALALYLRLGYLPAPHAIFDGVAKVRPGTIRWIGGHGDGADREEAFWALPPLGEGPVPAAAADELAELLLDAVRRRTGADVPVGAFLSGGIDSSLVVSLLAELGPVRTFSIGFDEAAFDESAHARRIAAHLGTDHTELRVTGADALGVVPRLPELYDEPLADQSAIPTVLLAAMARRDVAVALSGDGGDELFGGYDRYVRLARAQPLAALPAPLGRGLVGAARATGRALPAAARRARTVERVGHAVAAGGTLGLYRSIASLWEQPAEVVIGGREAPSAFDGPPWPRRGDLVRRAMGLDATTYLPDDVLVKVDRATMAVGLEARVPLLDPRVVTWARTWARPGTDGPLGTKAPLRRVLARRVPPALWDRPKMGFGAPVAGWLRGPLRTWADDLLDPALLRAGGLLEPGPIAERWAAHRAGTVDQSYPLWAVLTFQAWSEAWR